MSAMHLALVCVAWCNETAGCVEIPKDVTEARSASAAAAAADLASGVSAHSRRARWTARDLSRQSERAARGYRTAAARTRSRSPALAAVLVVARGLRAGRLGIQLQRRASGICAHHRTDSGNAGTRRRVDCGRASVHAARGDLFGGPPRGLVRPCGHDGGGRGNLAPRFLVRPAIADRVRYQFGLAPLVGREAARGGGGVRRGRWA